MTEVADREFPLLVAFSNTVPDICAVLHDLTEKCIEYLRFLNVPSAQTILASTCDAGLEAANAQIANFIADNIPISQVGGCMQMATR